MSTSSSPPGLGGVGLGDFGICVHKLVHGVGELENLGRAAESDTLNTEKYVKAIALSCREMFAAVGRLMEQEPLRVAAMVSAGVGQSSGQSSGAK